VSGGRGGPWGGVPRCVQLMSKFDVHEKLKEVLGHTPLQVRPWVLVREGGWRCVRCDGCRGKKGVPGCVFKPGRDNFLACPMETQVPTDPALPVCCCALWTPILAAFDIAVANFLAESCCCCCCCRFCYRCCCHCCCCCCCRLGVGLCWA
jgi:hypothetical protein